jgi:hypothetical protein
MAAVAGATGVRSWLAAHHFSWLTPPRLRRATIVLCMLALLGSSLGVSGSTKAPTAPAAPASHQLAR